MYLSGRNRKQEGLTRRVCRKSRAVAQRLASYLAFSGLFHAASAVSSANAGSLNDSTGSRQEEKGEVDRAGRKVPRTAARSPLPLNSEIGANGLYRLGAIAIAIALPSSCGSLIVKI